MTRSAALTSTDPSTLEAVTTVLSPDDAARLDLLRVAGDDGLLFSRESIGFAAQGEALRIDLPRGLADRADVASALGAIGTDRGVLGPGAGPVAFGALPFVPHEAASLVVPALTVARRADGTAWYTRVGPRSEPPRPRRTHTAGNGSAGAPGASGIEALYAIRQARWSPADFDLRSCTPHEQWCALIASAVERIRAGELDKVVLARAIDVTASGPIVVGDVLERLRSLFPSCTVFSIDGFVGASPELLVGRLDEHVAAHPLAGTVARSGDPDEDARRATALLASTKDRWEHALTVDAVVGALRPLCASFEVPDTPSIVPLRNVSHLGTYMRGDLRSPLPPALDLVERLHPTPAVGGVPTARALEVMAAIEPQSRGRYAGPVGWTDAAGNGEWMVGLRSAQIDGNRARMMAGGGIVADSDPREELAETQVKFQALLAAIVRP